MEYENELASLMAIELLHARRKTWVQRTQQVQLLGWKRAVSTRQHLGNKDWTVEWNQHDRDAFRSAVQVLYRTGYDPRGLISLIQILMRNPTSSPFDQDFLSDLATEVRREIAVFPPLRNPIIQSNQFLVFQKRVRRL